MADEAFVPEGLRKQREYLTSQANMQQPCWACGVPCDQFEAASSEEFNPFNTTSDKFVCPNCDTPMAVGVPFATVGPVHWFWHRPKRLIVTATEWRKES